MDGKLHGRRGASSEKQSVVCRPIDLLLKLDFRALKKKVCARARERERERRLLEDVRPPSGARKLEIQTGYGCRSARERDTRVRECARETRSCGDERETRVAAGCPNPNFRKYIYSVTSFRAVMDF
jgi:hypothetical protein